MNGLEVGGRERVVLELARRARLAGLDQRLVLYDTPFRDPELDLDPGEVPVHFLPRRAGLDWRYTAALARLARELGTRVLHAHNDTAIFYACAAAARLGPRRPAVVGTFHTRPVHATRGARWLTRLVSVRASALTAVSDDLARIVVDQGWVGRCRTLRNGIDLQAFAPDGPRGGWRERLEIPPGALLAGHIGRSDPVKRQADLLAAARELEGVEPAIVFVLVGRGPLHAGLVRAGAGRANVRFVPRVVDVAAFLRELDLFALCSEHEAAPRVLLEALACGRAIVSTDVGGVRELVDDPEAGPCARLVPAGAPARLAAALLELARDPVARGRLGAAARARAACFSSEHEWQEYLALWNEAVSGRYAA